MASIDDLPTFILHYILLLLSLRDAARTSILSRRWRNLWKQLDTYELDGSAFPDRQPDFSRLVDTVIYLHSGPGIKSLKLSHPRFIDGLNGGDREVSDWLHELASPQYHLLQTLDVDIGASLLVAPALFLCATLVDLRLVMGGTALSFNSAGSVRLPLLRRLCMEHSFFHRSVEFQNLVDGCPSLETLDLKYYELAARADPVGLDIRNPTLRRVRFQNCVGYGVAPIVISAPNLELFDLFGGYLVVTTGAGQGITSVTARTVRLLLNDSETAYHGFTPIGINFADIGRNVARLVSGFYNVTALCLSGWSLEYLSRVVDIINLPVWRLEVLAISGMWPNQGHAGVVLHLLQRSPRLQELFIWNELSLPLEIGKDEQRQGYPRAPDFHSSEMAGARRRRRQSQLRRFRMLNFTGNENEVNIVTFVRATNVALEMFHVMDASGQDCSARFRGN